MAKLKEGEKVKQEFLVTVKFTAGDGDVKFKAKDLSDALLSKYPAVKIIAKELKLELQA